MSLKIRSSSGTYNVRASELERDRPPQILQKGVKCEVHFLDESKEIFEIDKRSRSQALLDKVYDHLELVEKDYFGLQFAEVAPAPDAMRWLDPLKALKKQIKIGPPYTLHFRVKFYVSDPSKLAEEYTRYHFFLQMKKDILEGKLICPRPIAALLSSYAVQSELGDYNNEEITDGYLSEFRFIPNQDETFEKEVSKHHKLHKGQLPADSEYNFLNKAKTLDMYGVDLHSARDQSDLEIQLGVTSTGLVVFQNNTRINTFSWAKIIKISFKRKQFFIMLRREPSDNMDNLIGFNMASYRSCKMLWKSCVEHHTFFRLHIPKPTLKKGFFSLGSKFRYSGRTEYQTVEEGKRRARMERTFSRSPSKRYARRTVCATTRTEILNEKTREGTRNRPMSTTIVPNSTTHNNSINTTNVGNNGGLPAVRQYNSFNSKRSLHEDYRSRSSKAWSEIDRAGVDDDGGFLTRSRSREDFSNKPKSRSSQDFAPAIPPKVDSILDDSSSIQNSYSLPYPDGMVNGNGYVDGQGLVTINMKPDKQGRFGFNVKGGVDQGMPIIVSRVAPNTPADLCLPRLNEGDQVLYINGRDVTEHSHEQVVEFIRSARETHSGQLELVVRPNVYVGEDIIEEPAFEYQPDTHRIISTNFTESDPLSESLLLLQEGLESGAAIAQFEQMYRKKPGMTMHGARMPENVQKNRYRDISPYDQTRVILHNCKDGDYINGNYVNMEIPGSGIVNQYIAAQGPLLHTVQAFWQMIWEQQSRLIVMLTMKVERGRVKCHQYWPNLYETEDFGELQLTCLKEQETPSFAFREFTLVNVALNEELRIKQMQYIAWPDHGVPDDSSDFLDFVLRVRQNRVGMVEPCIVHCSAGIGRTGVLILMETAMCLIEAGQPVYPLDIVRQMRDQRAMLIQTASQYKFVCEAVLRVYSEQIVKPIEDYSR